jgi:hypothetical protein
MRLRSWARTVALQWASCRSKVVPFAAHQSCRPAIRDTGQLDAAEGGRSVALNEHRKHCDRGWLPPWYSDGPTEEDHEQQPGAPLDAVRVRGGVGRVRAPADIGSGAVSGRRSTLPAGAPCAGRVGRRRQEYSAERRRQTEQSRDPHSHTTIVNPGIGSKVKSTRRVQRRRLRWAPFCRTAPAASTVSASSKWAGRF